MKSPALTLGLVLALSGGLVSACSEDSGGSSADGTSVARIVGSTGRIAPNGGLLDTLHAGLRLIEVYDRTQNPVRYLAYRERIVTDGKRHYSVEPFEQVTAVNPNWSSFQLLQRMREGFIFRYRDFAIRDQALFSQNYTLGDLAMQEQVAGRACSLYRVEHTSGEGKTYDLAVDDETGIVLRYEEFDADGNPLSAMTYEAYAADPNVSNFRWHQPLNQELALDHTWDLSIQVGVKVDQPRIVPAGYELREAAQVTDGSRQRWLKLTYLDGVEPLFYMVALPDAPSQQGAILIDPLQATLGTVAVFQMGTARAVQGLIGGKRFFAVGKVGDDALLDLIESALP